MNAQPLSGRTIAVPETRELEVFAGMLERRGASVIRCPLVAIKDAPDPTPVLAWSGELAAGTFHDVILLTGEGLRRILACIERDQPALRTRFVSALERARKITRGPKPARALRELGLKSDIAAEVPTTAGVIASLQAHDLSGHHVGVQLYGLDPNRRLIEFLQNAGATAHPVAPYVYADAGDDQAVMTLLQRLDSGEVDAMAFTSTPQVDRLFAVGGEERVKAALGRTMVAAVGPVVSEALTTRGVGVTSMPTESFFLKPLTSALEAALGGEGAPQ